MKRTESIFEDLVVWTHNGQFHADEVTAVALLNLFYPAKNVKVIRAPWKPKAKYDIAVDIGGEFNGHTKFDHHHDPNIEAACVLIGNWLVSLEHLDVNVWSNLYQSIFKYISQVDRGIITGGGERYAINALIRNLNDDDDNSDEPFHRAVKVSETLILGAYTNIITMLNQDKNWDIFDKHKGVVEMRDKKCRRWKSFAKKEDIIFAVAVSERNNNEGALTTIDSKQYPITDHPNQTFLHKAKFFASYDSYDNALKHALEMANTYQS